MISVLGAGGFIGRAVVAALERAAREYRAFHGDEPVAGQPLGHVIYCIGVTADFRTRPFDTVRAHCSRLSEVLEHATFESLLYLSSTRLYLHALDGVNETQRLALDPADPSQLYDLSKAMGESLCLTTSQKTRVARLSNVFGPGAHPGDFLPSVIREALSGRLVLQTGLDSAKDYVAVDEIAPLLIRIAVEGRQRIYNVASGVNVTHREIARRLTELTGCTLEVEAGARTLRYPRIAADRVREEFDFSATPLLEALPALVRAHSQSLTHS